MKKEFRIPVVSCSDSSCEGYQHLYVKTNGIKISDLKLICQLCGQEENILEQGGEKYTQSKKEVERLTKELSKLIISLRRKLPKSKDEWDGIVKNPKHPFTASIISGLVILMLELSGFGVFMALTWILGNLILNPVGWVLIPIVVAIVFYYRGLFTQKKLEAFRKGKEDLKIKLDSGEINEEEYNKAMDELYSEFINAD